MIASLVLAATLANAPAVEPSWGGPLTIAECSDAPPSLPAQTHTALDATLLVRTSGGTGSAVFVSADGFALTAAHVVGTAQTVQVRTHDGHDYEAEVLRVATEQDVALLHVDVVEPTACLGLLPGDADLGSDVFILGSPAGEELSFSVSKGVVSGYRDFDEARFVQLDASVNPGNSGGPAVSATGFVVGIASWKVSHVSMEGLAFAVPARSAGMSLGLLWGTSSDSDWRDKRGARSLGIVGGKLAPSPPEGSQSFSVAQVKRQNAKRGLITAGVVLMSVGLPMIIGTAIAHRRQDRMPSRRWKIMKGFNTAGWASSMVGAGLLVTGIVLPKRPRGAREVAVVPTGNGLVVSGRF